jgi:hypothetical protein
MKQLALTILARTLTDTDVRRLRDLFTAMDLDKDGRIDAGDLHGALDKVGDWGSAAAARGLVTMVHVAARAGRGGGLRCRPAGAHSPSRAPHSTAGMHAHTRQ